MDYPDIILAGERHATMTSGGRCGDLHDRPVEAVRELVLGEYLSVAGALDRFGMVIDPATLRVDGMATIWL